jgi:hypothetical protein
MTKQTFSKALALAVSSFGTEQALNAYNKSGRMPETIGAVFSAYAGIPATTDKAGKAHVKSATVDAWIIQQSAALTIKASLFADVNAALHSIFKLDACAWANNAALVPPQSYSAALAKQAETIEKTKATREANKAAKPEAAKPAALAPSDAVALLRSMSLTELQALPGFAALMAYASAIEPAIV